MIKLDCSSYLESVLLNTDNRLLNKEKLVNFRNTQVLLKVNILFIMQVLELLCLSVPSLFVVQLHSFIFLWDIGDCFLPYQKP